jgi:hypothetical protein
VRALLEARPILFEDKPEVQAGIVSLGGLRAGENVGDPTGLAKLGFQIFR